MSIYTIAYSRLRQVIERKVGETLNIPADQLKEHWSEISDLAMVAAAIVDTMGKDR